LSDDHHQVDGTFLPSSAKQNIEAFKWLLLTEQILQVEQSKRPQEPLGHNIFYDMPPPPHHVNVASILWRAKGKNVCKLNT